MDTGTALHDAGDDGPSQRHPRTRTQGFGALTISNQTGKNRTGIYTILTDATSLLPRSRVRYCEDFMETFIDRHIERGRQQGLALA